MSNKTPNITNSQDFTISSDKKTLLEYRGYSRCVVVPDGIEEISWTGFRNSKVENVILPSSLVKIGSSVFSGCEKLISIVIPDNVTKIDFLAFEDCVNLVSMIIPDKVNKIENATFKGCKNLTSLVIGNSVVSIGQSAFYDCKKLKKILIPASVVCIEEWVFHNCRSLTTIDVDENSPNFSSVDGVLYNKDKTVLIHYPAGKSDTEFKIPESVTEIGNRAFYGCKILKL